MREAAQTLGFALKAAQKARLAKFLHAYPTQKNGGQNEAQQGIQADPRKKRAVGLIWPLGTTAVNLYDVMGPVAIAGGVSASYGASKPAGVSWVALGAAFFIGVAVFISLRRATIAAPPSILPAMYVATPLAVLGATIISAWSLRALLQ